MQGGLNAGEPLTLRPHAGDRVCGTPPLGPVFSKLGGPGGGRYGRVQVGCGRIPAGVRRSGAPAAAAARSHSLLSDNALPLASRQVITDADKQRVRPEPTNRPHVVYMLVHDGASPWTEDRTRLLAGGQRDPEHLRDHILPAVPAAPPPTLHHCVHQQSQGSAQDSCVGQVDPGADARPSDDGRVPGPAEQQQGARHAACCRRRQQAVRDGVDHGTRKAAQEDLVVITAHTLLMMMILVAVFYNNCSPRESPLLADGHLRFALNAVGLLPHVHTRPESKRGRIQLYFFIFPLYSCIHSSVPDSRADSHAV